MKILYILKHNPWGIGGGCYACRNYMDAFMDVFHGADFDFCICEEYLKDRIAGYPENVRFIGVKPRGRFCKLLSPITGLLHRHQKIAKKMIRHGKYDYCLFDHNSIAGSLVRTCKKNGVKTIVLNHNCEQEYFRDNNSRTKNYLLLPTVRKNEKKSYQECTYNIFLTKEDELTFNKLYGHSNTKSVVGGCFFKKGEEINVNENKEYNKGRLKIVISGTMGNVQNLDGINYFLDELYPMLPDNIDVVMTGKNPPDSLIEKVESYSNIEIIANPENILEVVEQCDIFLCPTRLGGGMKLRVMDGLRCGLPVIAHSVSARGYSEFIKERYLWAYKNKEDFINALNSIVKCIEDGVFEPQHIQHSAMKNFSFKERINTLKHIFV